jgi:hypothetical protein
MHQEVELPGIGDTIEVLGYALGEHLREYDGCEGQIVGIFKDSRGTKCATVIVKSEAKGRRGKRYFILEALKKTDSKEAS